MDIESAFAFKCVACVWLRNNGNQTLVTDPYACMMYIVSPLAGPGAGILWRPPAYSLFLLFLDVVTFCTSPLTRV